MALLDTHARQLGSDFQLESGLSHTEAGGYRLELAADFVVEMSPLDEGFLFAAEVGKMAEGLAEKLLLANLFGQGTGKAVLGLDGKGRAVRLTQVHASDVTYAEYKENLEAFLNYAEFWKGELASHGREADR